MNNSLEKYSIKLAFQYDKKRKAKKTITWTAVLISLWILSVFIAL